MLNLRPTRGWGGEAKFEPCLSPELHVIIRLQRDMHHSKELDQTVLNHIFAKSHDVSCEVSLASKVTYFASASSAVAKIGLISGFLSNPSFDMPKYLVKLCSPRGPLLKQMTKYLVKLCCLRGPLSQKCRKT